MVQQYIVMAKHNQKHLKVQGTKMGEMILNIYQI